MRCHRFVTAAPCYSALPSTKHNKMPEWISNEALHNLMMILKSFSHKWVSCLETCLPWLVLPLCCINWLSVVKIATTEAQQKLQPRANFIKGVLRLGPVKSGQSTFDPKVRFV